MAAEGHPIDQNKYLSFFHSRSWYPQNWFLDIWDLMCDYNVAVVTYGMQRSLGNSPKMLDEDSNTWLLNMVYNGGLFGIDDETGLYGTNPLIYPDFKEIIEREKPCVYD